MRNLINVNQDLLHNDVNLKTKFACKFGYIKVVNIINKSLNKIVK